LYDRILQKIAELERNRDINNLKYKKNLKKKKISEKYFPPSQKTKNLFIVEGFCIHENTEIFVMRNNKLKNLKIKNLREGDEVITHKNRFREITQITKKVTNAWQIKTTLGNIVCSMKHRWLVYDSEKDSYYFEETQNLDKSKHRLVKNYLAFLEGFVKIEEIYEIDDEKYDRKIILSSGEYQVSTNSHKFCIFDAEIQEFVMREAKDLSKGDLISCFSLL
jgi:hypothetical protein